MKLVMRRLLSALPRAFGRAAHAHDYDVRPQKRDIAFARAGIVTIGVMGLRAEGGTLLSPDLLLHDQCRRLSNLLPVYTGSVTNSVTDAQNCFPLDTILIAQWADDARALDLVRQTADWS